MKKTKTVRILSLLLAALLCLLPLSACGKRSSALADLPETDELVIYLPKEMEKYLMEDYIVPYRALYPEVNVRLVIVPGDEDYLWKDYSEKVVNEVVAGGGPDVLLLDYLPNLDVEKAARNYSFYDLTDLVASDPDFLEDDYLDGVLNAVKVGGRLYTMPRGFRAPNYLSDRAKLEELGFNWDEIEKTSDFIGELVRLTPAAAEQEEFQTMLESNYRFRDLLGFSGIRLLDYENRKVLPDEADFRAFLESYKAFYPYDYGEPGRSWSSNYAAPHLMQGEFVFWSVDSFYDMNWNTRDMMSAGHGCTLRMLPGENGEIAGQITKQIALNAASKNVRNAYNFIKMLSSEEFMTMSFWDNHTPLNPVSIHHPFWDAPVLKKAVEAGVRGEGRLTSNPLITDEEEDELVRLYTGIDRFTVRLNDSVFNMLWEAVLPYLEDKESMDDCLTELRRKLEFYMSE